MLDHNIREALVPHGPISGTIASKLVISSENRFACSYSTSGVLTIKMQISCRKFITFLPVMLSRQ